MLQIDSHRATREDVVRAALDWCGTPFHDCARVKGVGVDCAQLLVAVFSSVGLIEDFAPHPYSPQWFLHRDEPKFLNLLAQHAHRVAVALPGDVLMYNFGRHAAHGGIVIDEFSFVHAYKPLRCVMRDSLVAHAHRLHSCWSLFGESG